MNIRQIKAFPAVTGAVNFRRVNPDLVTFLPRLHWRPLLTGVGLFGLFVALLAVIQFATPNLVGNDGYFHIKLAWVMREQRLLPPFPWLSLTILNAETFFDHHFLYHFLLIPFTGGDLRQGAKWASVLLPASTFLVGWILLRGQRVPYAALWSLGFLAGSEAFIYRMSMPRVQSVSLLMLLLSLHLTLTRRYRWLLPLAFLYVWLYDAFPFVLIMVGVYVGARWLLEGKFELAPLLYTLLGIVLGLFINPYFPDNLIFIYHHWLPKLTHTNAVKVGNEWYPYKTWTLVENSGPALAMFAAGVFALGLGERRMNTSTATLLLITILFGGLLLKSRRFVEYYPAFALLFCALAWSPLIRSWGRSNVCVRRVLPVGLVILLVPAIGFNVLTARESLQQSKPYQRYAEASAWLKANTPAGSRIFQTDWDDFTQLYFYNTHNTYTLGLDPTYMQLHDPELYDVWVDISRGRIEAPGPIITKEFGANYVLTDLNHKSFLRQAKADPHMEEVYRDEYAAIFRVFDAPVEEKGG